MASPLLQENVWLKQQKFEDAERLYRLLEAGTAGSCGGQAGGAGGDSVLKRLEAVEKENKDLRIFMSQCLGYDEGLLQLNVTEELRSIILSLQSSKGAAVPATTPLKAPAPAATPSKAEPKKKTTDDDDDDEDLFGSYDEETKALKAKRVKEYEEKKSKKPALIAKSTFLLDVKPWDDETYGRDGKKAKLVEVGYGIKKLTIMCIVEDDKVSIEDLSEKITGENEDLVQSVDIAAFNKI